MADLDFFVDVVVSGGVLGVGLSESPEAVAHVLGGDFVEDRSRSTMRRDYGLVEFFWSRLPGSEGWDAAGFTVQVHRLATVEVVDELVDRYGPFGGRLPFARLDEESLPKRWTVHCWSRKRMAPMLRLPLFMRCLSLSLNLFGGFETACLVQVLGFADRWVGGDLLVAGASRAARSWPSGFRRTGGNGQFAAQVAKAAPDPGRGQPARFGSRAFPGAAQITREIPAQA